MIVSAEDFSEGVPLLQPALLDSLPEAPLILDAPTEVPFPEESPTQEPALTLPQPESVQKSFSDMLIDLE